MNVSLIRISFSQKNTLREILTKYLIELSEIIGEEIDISYPYLDSYFIEENRAAYFILNQEHTIGFCMVNDYCLIQENEIAIAEFYIQKDFRKKGFAFEAAKQIFKLSNKKWEVKTSLKNEVALGFWRKAILKKNETKIDDEIFFSFYN